MFKQTPEKAVGNIREVISHLDTKRGGDYEVVSFSVTGNTSGQSRIGASATIRRSDLVALLEENIKLKAKLQEVQS